MAQKLPLPSCSQGRAISHLNLRTIPLGILSIEPFEIFSEGFSFDEGGNVLLPLARVVLYPTYSKLFREKQLAAGRRSEAEENFQQKIILFASMEKFKKENSL